MMFKAPSSRYNEKGRMFNLLAKRNKQIHNIFEKLKDPVVLVRVYKKVHKIRKEFFPHEKKAEDFWDVLTWARQRNSFFESDLKKTFGFNEQRARLLIAHLMRKGLISEKREGRPFIYWLSPDGNLFLDKFSKRCASILAEEIKK